MLLKRIIPCLLIKDGGLVKTEKFQNPKYVGDPINAVKIFNEKEADEIIIIDIKATIEKKINFDLLSKIFSECFVPICYGGGISTIEDAKSCFSKSLITDDTSFDSSLDNFHNSSNNPISKNCANVSFFSA